MEVLTGAAAAHLVHGDQHNRGLSADVIGGGLVNAVAAVGLTRNLCDRLSRQGRGFRVLNGEG